MPLEYSESYGGQKVKAFKLHEYFNRAVYCIKGFPLLFNSA